MQKIIPNLWFNNEAEEAAKFYTSIFPNSKMNRITLYPKAAEEVSGKKAGTVLTVDFTIDDTRFIGLNGGPDFKFSEAISFLKECDTQQEIDMYWEKLTAGGGKPGPCGWLTDKFGVSWQISPKVLDDLINDPDQDKVERVTAAMLKMEKLVIADLQKAANEA